MRCLLMPALLLALAAVPACGGPPKPPAVGRVATADALRLCFRPKGARVVDFNGNQHTPNEVDRTFRDLDDAIARFERALVTSLERAGYSVSRDGPCDAEVQDELRFEGRGRLRHHHTQDVERISDARVGLFDVDEKAVDIVEVHDAADLEIERVAAALVDAVVASPKVKQFAAEQHSSPVAAPERPR